MACIVAHALPAESLVLRETLFELRDDTAGDSDAPTVVCDISIPPTLLLISIRGQKYRVSLRDLVADLISAYDTSMGEGSNHATA